MTLKLGAYTACLRDRPLGQAPDMAVNIEHEDASYSRLDGLAIAARNLRAAAATM